MNRRPAQKTRPDQRPGLQALPRELQVVPGSQLQIFGLRYSNQSQCLIAGYRERLLDIDMTASLKTLRGKSVMTLRRRRDMHDAGPRVGEQLSNVARTVWRTGALAQLLCHEQLLIAHTNDGS
jgi:hypothetical protein